MKKLLSKGMDSLEKDRRAAETHRDEFATKTSENANKNETAE